MILSSLVEHDPTQLLIQKISQLTKHLRLHVESHHQLHELVQEEQPLWHLTEQIPIHIPTQE